MCKGSTAAVGRRVLWTSEFGARTLRELIVLALEVITTFLMCSGRKFNTGGVSNICEYSSEIQVSPTRCNNCVFILRNGFTLHVSGDNLTHHQEYICCIWPQVSRLN